MQGCTIVDQWRLPHALVLARQFRGHHPGMTFHVLVLDKPANVSVMPAGVRLLRPIDVGVDDEHLGLLAAQHGPDALPYAVLPHLLRALGDEPAVFLAPTTAVVSELAELFDALEDSEVVVVPSFLEPPSEGRRRPSSRALLDEVGVIGRSVFAWRRGATGDAVLELWPKLLADGAALDESDVNVFQRWLDALPAARADVTVLRHPGYGLAYWNIESRPLSEDNGALRTNGEPLRLLDLRRFDPSRPELLAP